MSSHQYTHIRHLLHNTGEENADKITYGESSNKYMILMSEPHDWPLSRYMMILILLILSLVIIISTTHTIYQRSKMMTAHRTIHNTIENDTAMDDHTSTSTAVTVATSISPPPMTSHKIYWLHPFAASTSVIYYLIYGILILLSFHCCDNIANPVAYFQYQFLYERHLFTTQELPFLIAIFKLSLLYITLQAALNAGLEQSRIQSYSIVLIHVFTLVSFTSLLHYIAERPFLFTVSANVGIIFVPFLTVVLNAYLYLLSTSQSHATYLRLPSTPHSIHTNGKIVASSSSNTTD